MVWLMNRLVNEWLVKVADWLMKGGHGGDEDEDMDIDSETGI